MRCADASRPKSEEEKRARTLDSKRRWARKNRAEKTGAAAAKAGSADPPAPSLAGSVGTPASEQSSEQAASVGAGGAAGANAGDDEGDSSFDAGSQSGWSDGAGGVGAGPPLHYPHAAYGAPPPGNPFYGAGGASVYGRTPTKHGYAPPGFFAGGGGGAMDPYYAGAGGLSRAPPPPAPHLGMRASMPPAPPYAHDDPRVPLHLRDPNSYAPGGAEDGPSPGGAPLQQHPHHPHAALYPYHASPNPYSHPFMPHHAAAHAHAHQHQVAQEQAHGAGVFPLPPFAHDEYGQPLLGAPPPAPRRPSSNPSFGTSAAAGGPAGNPYDHPAGAVAGPSSSQVVTAGQPAPVALPYYARRHASLARALTGAHSGIAAGVPMPSITATGAAPASARGAAGGLESPVKLRRTGPTGKGKEVGGAGAGAGGGSGGAGGLAAPGDDAAGILLALKAGPSSPMTARDGHVVQSPVSSVRDQAGDRDRARRGLTLGRGARAGPQRGGRGTKPETSEPESEADDAARSKGDDDDSDDDDEAEVRAMMLRSRAAAASAAAAGGSAMSPWRAALQNQHPAPAVAGPVVSPRKRGRSESPAPNLASTSSGEGGSTAAAHALLATAKKAHQYASVANGGGAAGQSRAAPWSNHEMSLVATPTPGNLMRIAMESSPVVRFGNGGGGGGDRGAGAVGAGDGESEADMMGGARAAADDDDDDDDGVLDAEHAFTSSSGGARRPRHGRSVSPSSQKGRRARGVPGAGGSSSSGAGGSSSSQPRALHHHHPVGLTSELGDFDLQHSSSSSAMRHHHHHDPLCEDESAMGSVAAHPNSSSSSSSHLVTPAPTASRTTTSNAAAAAAAAAALQQPQPTAAATHPHDPFLAAPGTSASLPLTMAGSGSASSSAAANGEAPMARTSSPPGGGFSSFLFSSPAHPQFSKTLGLTAAPGPGVLYTGGAGETPARGGGGGGARGREPSQDELLALATAQSHRERMLDAVKTPVMARVALEGARRAAASTTTTGSAAAGAGGAGSAHPSDLESTEGDGEGEDEGSATTGTVRDESQSPGKVTLDGDEEDDEEDGASLDE